jgi:hypothetical protein
MIYNCAFCGWRINQRYNHPELKKEEVGKYLLHEHKPFCHEYCIEWYKCCKTKPIYPVSDLYENGRWGDWKTERKINRPKRAKNRHELDLAKTK